MGDDLIDIGMMQNVGVAVAVADAPKIVKKYASYITGKKGGDGAVREVVENIIKAQNLEGKILRFVKNLKK
jgi:3-deoxy-D-manno-octulosonate 8-phosphate phosphatase (KDO 8-P phosphatase)